MKKILSRPSESNAVLFWRYFLIYLAIFSVVFILTLWGWLESSASHEKQLAIGKEEVVLNLHAEQVQREISDIVSDLQILSSLNYSNLKSPDANALQQIKNTFTAFMRARDSYDQLRLLDASGMEVIRVNRTANGPELVPHSHLQNKSSRYYFTETVRLPKGEFYLSRLDLNIENGLVEVPFKPMLRVGMPIYDAQNQVNGVLVVNYLAQNIIQLLEHSAAHQTTDGHAQNMELLDSFGFWLYSEDVEKSWGFMFNMLQKSLGYENAELWRVMQTSLSGSYEEASGVYVYQFINPAFFVLYDGDQPRRIRFNLAKDVGDGYGWYLMNFYSHDYFFERALGDLQKNAVWFVVLFMTLLSFAVFVAWFSAYRHDLNQRTHFLAFHDGLTGVLSRSAWTNTLRKEVDVWVKESKNFAIAYVDLNDFKPINDVHGHVVGDNVLKITAQRLQSAVREGDYVVRLGGDEFFIVFTQFFVNDDSQYLQHKLKGLFAEPVNFDDYSLKLSISVGISIYPVDGHSVDELLQIADERMYEDKSKSKSPFKAKNAENDLEGNLAEHAEPPSLASKTESGSEALDSEAKRSNKSVH